NFIGCCASSGVRHCWAFVSLPTWMTLSPSFTYSEAILSRPGESPDLRPSCHFSWSTSRLGRRVSGELPEPLHAGRIVYEEQNSLRRCIPRISTAHYDLVIPGGERVEIPEVDRPPVHRRTIRTHGIGSQGRSLFEQDPA